MSEIEQRVQALENYVKHLQEQDPQHKDEKQYSVLQVATLVGIKPAGINYHLRMGNLKHTGKKSYKRITESQLNEFIANQRK
jgi:hypothetical protein